MTITKCTERHCVCSSVEKLAGGTYRYQISDESLDCDGERILVAAWTKLGAYPLHVDHVVTHRVGTARVFIRDGALIADVTIDDPEVRARVERGELAKASVGFRRLESERTTSGKIVTTRAELREVSLVDAGCNFSARREKSGGIPRRRVTKEQAIATVRREARETFHAGAVETLCLESGALDEEGLRRKMATSPQLAHVVRAVFQALDARADAIASDVAQRLS